MQANTLHRVRKHFHQCIVHCYKQTEMLLKENYRSRFMALKTIAVQSLDIKFNKETCKRTHMWQAVLYGPVINSIIVSSVTK